MNKVPMALLLLLVLMGCVATEKREHIEELPYRAWEIGLIAPNYMEVWVESVDVTDLYGRKYLRVHGGVSSVTNPPENRGDPTGWPARPGVGKTRPMTGLALPKTVSVRWQSLAEPQTYNARIDIPEWARVEMLTGHEAYCRFDEKNITAYRYAITLGLAPGGIVKAWLTGACLEPIEIGRFEGSINPEGPSRGQTNGRYALPLDPAAQHYLETHEIPFGSW
ncbi:MAG: DUF2931 family protein [Halopseudomonas sp.]|uniref:DUF2931 family protein n=1 Tax=Halopseudomonas sp. TaxID=2901191 RepID=UPI003002614B